METSAIGIHARSAIISVIINSNGCISPIWRLPIRRIKTISVIIIISVLKKVTAILLIIVKTVVFMYKLLTKKVGFVIM